VEAAISRIRTLPEESKTPEISRIIRHETIMRIVLSGPFAEASIKAHAKRMRDDMLDRGVDKVDLFGSRDEEIIVEVPSTMLRRLDLTLADVASRIGETSQDLPSGDIGGGQRQIRSLGLLTTARGLEGIEVKALEDGRKVYLRDIAEVSEGFDDDMATARRNGRRAIELHVQRAIESDALKLAAIANDYLDEVEGTLPSNLSVERYEFATDLLQDRIDLLVRNGAGGLVIVIVVLLVFLKGRVAFWVMVGIPVSIMATFGAMLAMGQSINMISLFGLIMTIGIIVDDAIVVGEHADTRSRLGLSALDAAVNGAQRMAIPVTCAALTSISAFAPLFVISGIIGQIIVAIPMVVVAVLIASLIECFFVLPAHLRGALSHEPADRPGLYGRFRVGFDRRFEGFRDGPFRSFLQVCVNWRYATLAMAFGLLILAIGMVAGGRVGFNFFPSPEADTMFANVQMVSGTPREQTQEMLDELDRALAATVRDFEGEDSDLVRMALVQVGTVAGRAVGPSAAPSDNIGGMTVELRTADKRDIRTDTFVEAWRAAIRPRPGLETMTIQPATGGPPGKDVDVRLIGTDIADLKRAAEALKLLLKRYPGVSAIEDDLPYGKLETILEVTQRGRALDFATDSVGRQVRNAVEGAIAKRFARADEEVTVRVRLPENELDTDVLDRLYLRGPSGAEVPLTEVASLRANQSFARINREDGRRQVAVTAKLNPGITTTQEVLAAIQRDGLWDIAKRYGLTIAFKGKSEEQQETFADMRTGAMIGLAGIYIILAWAFASYVRPFVVMAIIPMGFVGAVIGHYLLNYNLTILSMMALIGLSGIVVNNSIILVTTIERRTRSQELREAIIDGSCDRLRAIILTSATTIGGLTPLLFEKSLQAQFLIPMALTLVFGLACATMLVLVVVPALVAVQDDVRRMFGMRHRQTYHGSAEAHG
jgi:multidrug efflux pump subunit AcrB